MKKLVLSIALAMGIVSIAQAVPSDNCGCGLGTMIFEGEDGLVSQTLAVTTNGALSANILFGITSGTLDCDQADSFVSIDRLEIFVAGNMDSLATDIAVGEGEYLTTLADLMAVDEADRATFASKLQQSFGKIYTADDITHEQVVENIIDVSRS
jgi:hypothetical protein